MTSAREKSDTIRHIRLGVVLAWALTLVVLSAPGQTQETRAANAEMDERAMAVLQRMAEFLSQTQRFSVTVDIGFDAVQDSGQKIEFGETRKIVLRRPDHLRIDATKRDGSQSAFLFDGKEMTVFHPQEHVYATAARLGSVDEAIAYFVHSGCCYGGYYGGAGGAYAAGVVTGAVIGATMTAAAFSAQAPSCTTVIVSGLSYYQCGSTWYQPATQGSQVTYIVVNPPK